MKICLCVTVYVCMYLYAGIHLGSYAAVLSKNPLSSPSPDARNHVRMEQGVASLEDELGDLMDWMRRINFRLEQLGVADLMWANINIKGFRSSVRMDRGLPPCQVWRDSSLDSRTPNPNVRISKYHETGVI